MDDRIRELKKNYKFIEDKIEERINEFKNVWQSRNVKNIYKELCFCLCTPQSKAVLADKAITLLDKKNVLYRGDFLEIRKYMTGVRFPNNKSKYIVDVRKNFIENGKIKILDFIDENNILSTREFLITEVKGYGYKEASHFLRNIGFVEDVAILDRHILRNLLKYNVIKDVPNLTKKNYLEIEDKFKNFAKDIKIPMSHLDLFFWYNETGFIFK